MDGQNSLIILSSTTNTIANDNHPSYSVHIFDTTSDASQHSLHTHILLEQAQAHAHAQEAALSKQSFIPPLLSQSIGKFATNQTPKAVRPHQRSLTDVASPLAVYNEMNVYDNDPPGSPPGLTSKSSKSSTNQSSSLSGADGIISDITHFEDIVLGEEESQPFRSKLMNGVDTQSRPLPHTAATTMNGHRNNTATMATMRDLTNQGRYPSYPRLPDSFKSNPPVHSLHLPYGGPLRKGIRNASTPSLAITAMSNYNRSRSPSPISPTQSPPKAVPSPKSPRRPGPNPARIPQIPVRRGSWQPSRKSIKELEAECDDADEDLPDDASLWNVPLSPRPPSERAAPLSPVTSPRISPGTSPERSSPLRTSVGSDGTIISAPKSAPIHVRQTLPATFHSPPNSPRRLFRGASTGMLPDHSSYPRSKSWNVALSELSEEAQSLTETLENHAIAAEIKQEHTVQNGGVASMGTLTRAKTASSVELPPLRVNNIMIDPLPISKEKEKVLSRTRPSWLPPKSKSEEKKHLKEYQRMMEFSKEAERRKAAKLADNQCVKDDTKSALLRIWEEHVLPNWDQVVREPRTRELWWRGVAPKSRAQVWQKAMGNELALTEVTYDKALQRAKSIEADISRNNKPDQHRREEAWFDAIRRDVKTTFPDLKIFQPSGPLHSGLVDILMAYSLYRSDIGYSHGTHLIAAFLYLTLPTPSQTFICLANLMNRPLPLAFLTGDPAATGKAYDLTLSLLRRKYPRLHNHLFGSSAPPNASTPQEPSLNLPPSLVLEPMMRTLFLGPGQGLGIDIAARVWDVMVFDGDAAILRTTVAVLGELEGKLYGGRDEVLAVLGWRGFLGSVGDEEAFMAKVRAVGKAG